MRHSFRMSVASVKTTDVVVGDSVDIVLNVSWPDRDLREFTATSEFRRVNVSQNRTVYTTLLNLTLTKDFTAAPDYSQFQTVISITPAQTTSFGAGKYSGTIVLSDADTVRTLGVYNFSILKV